VKRTGSPKKLADLIRNGLYDPEALKTTTAETLRKICNAVEILIPANASKVHTFYSNSWVYMVIDIVVYMFTGTDDCSLGTSALIHTARRKRMSCI